MAWIERMHLHGITGVVGQHPYQSAVGESLASIEVR